MEEKMAAPAVKPPSPRDHLEQAKKLAEEKKWGECYSKLKAQLVRGAGLPGFLSLHSRCAMSAGQREDALNNLNVVATSASAKLAASIRNSAQILSATFATAESSQSFQEGLNLLERGAYPDANERLTSLLSVEAGNVELMLRVGQARILLGKAEEARDLLAKAKSLNPQEAEIALWYGRALFLRGRHQAALDELRRARRMILESELASLWLSEALVALGARAQAFQALEQDLKYYPAHLQTLTQLARFRLLFFENDAEMLMAARKEVQLGLSRLDQYRSASHPRTEGELGLQLASADEIKSQLKVLMDRIEAKQAELKVRKE